MCCIPALTIKGLKTCFTVQVNEPAHVKYLGHWSRLLGGRSTRANFWTKPSVEEASVERTSKVVAEYRDHQRQALLYFHFCTSTARVKKKKRKQCKGQSINADFFHVNEPPNKKTDPTLASTVTVRLSYMYTGPKRCLTSICDISVISKGVLVLFSSSSSLAKGENWIKLYFHKFSV